jgi:hypothetical protein
MMEPSEARSFGFARIWLGAGLFVFVLALLLSWALQRRLDALLGRVDARALEASAKVLDDLVAQQRRQLRATVAVLADDTRVRAMVLTPTFDQATVVDLLTDLRASSGASVIALLDGGGKVRAVVGAPEMDQLDLGSSSLVRAALEQASAQPWVFASKVGVLAGAPVRLDGQVQALFMMGFEIDDALLEGVQRATGAIGAIFVGDAIVASASKQPELEPALRLALELPQGSYGIVSPGFWASCSRLSDAAVAVGVAWLLPDQRHAGEVTLTRALSWLPAVLVGLVLAFMIGLVLSQSRSGNP